MLKFSHGFHKTSPDRWSIPSLNIGFTIPLQSKFGMPKLFRLSMLSNKEIAFEEAIVEGFEKLPDALNSLHDGKHTGKVLVRV